jgi:hypothetical protein
MHAAHSRRTAHAHTRQQRSAAAHSHSAYTLHHLPHKCISLRRRKELTYLPVCSEEDEGRRALIHAHTHPHRPNNGSHFLPSRR